MYRTLCHAYCLFVFYKLIEGGTGETDKGKGGWGRGGGGGAVLNTESCKHLVSNKYFGKTCPGMESITEKKSLDMS